MAEVIINQERCKGCSLCIMACPKKIIYISKDIFNNKAYNPAAISNMNECSGCTFCAIICPDCAIEIIPAKITKGMKNA